MAREKLINAPTAVTLSSGVNSSVTTLPVSSIPAALAYPARCLVDTEIMTISAGSGSNLTVARGAEGTTGASHSSGASVTFPVTAAGFLSNGPTATYARTNVSNLTWTPPDFTTFVDTTFTLTIPETGLYMFLGTVRSYITFASGSGGLCMMVALFSGATMVGEPWRVGDNSEPGTPQLKSGAIVSMTPYAGTAGEVLKLYAQVQSVGGSPVVGACVIASDAQGVTGIIALRIA